MGYRTKPEKPEGHESCVGPEYCQACDEWSYDLIMWEEEEFQQGRDPYSPANDNLKEGMVVSDRTVLDCLKLYERHPGDVYAGWVAICYKEREFHPFVVWNIYATDTGFTADSGDYYKTLGEAVRGYIARGGKVA